LVTHKKNVPEKYSSWDEIVIRSNTSEARAFKRENRAE
jgi:hypothetical protein